MCEQARALFPTLWISSSFKAHSTASQYPARFLESSEAAQKILEQAERFAFTQRVRNPKVLSVAPKIYKLCTQALRSLS